MRLVVCILLQMLALLYINLNAQVYYMNTNNGQIINTCKATISSNKTCDDGTGIPSYCNNDNYTVTFYSGSATKQIRISFPSNSFFTEDGFDSLKIYNGSSTTSPKIADLTGYLTTPFSYVSTGGYLTLKFTSDALFNDWGFTAYIGCEVQSCNGNIPASDNCADAPQICDLNNYCGTTSGWYTPDNYNTLGSDFGGVFCGSIENNSWLKFVANTSQASFEINSYGCLNTTSGVEAQIFRSTNCSSFSAVSNCIKQNTSSGVVTITTNNSLIAGQTYYLMIDGYQGNQCDYTIKALSGVQSLTLTSPRDTICPGQTATIKVNGYIAGSTFAWSPTGSIIGSTTSDTVRVKPNSTTVYTCTITQPNGCTVQVEKFTIHTTAPPNANAGADKVLTCTNPAIEIIGTSTTPNVIFQWSGPGIVSGNNNDTVVVNLPGGYILTVIDTAVGCSNTDIVSVSSTIALPNANAGGDKILTCAQPQVVLTGSSTTAGVEFSWMGPGIVSGGNTATPTVDIAGTYTLTVTNPSSGCTKTDEVVVTLSATLPIANAGPDKNITCSTNNVTLSGSSGTPGVTYLWSGPGILSGGGTLTPLVNVAGTYELTVTITATGCKSKDITLVADNRIIPNADAGPNKTITCISPNVQLNASSTTSGVTYTWSGPGIVSGNGTNVPLVNAVGTYNVIVRVTATGCTNTDFTVVNKDVVPPGANAGNDDSLDCLNPKLKLFGTSTTSGVTFNWTGIGILSAANTDTPTINKPGIYILTVTNPVNNCKSNDSVIVFQTITPPEIDAGPDKQINCINTTVTLNGSSSSPNIRYSWAGIGIVSGANTPSPVINAAGTFVLTVTDTITGCTSIDNAVVTKDNLLPNANAGNDKILTCTNTTVTLDGSSIFSNVSYTWTGPGIVSGANTATPTVNTVGTYTLTVTRVATGCFRTDIAVVTADIILPNAQAGVDRVLTCKKPLDTLIGSSTTANTTFSWSGTGIISTITPNTVVINNSGQYILTVTNTITNCKNNDTILVSYDTIPPHADAGITKNIDCLIPTVTLNGSSNTSNVSYSWSGPNIISGENSPNVVVSNSGIYYLEVTNNINGCKNIDSVIVTKSINLPDVFAGGDKKITCYTPTPSLIGSTNTANTIFSWSGPGIISNPSLSTITVNTAGTYIFTVTNNTNGCKAIDQSIVTLFNTAPDVNAGSDKILTCSAPSVQLNGSSLTADVNYSWTGIGIISGSNDATCIVNSAGTYNLTVQDTINGCTSTDFTVVTQTGLLPNVNAGPDKLLSCKDTTVVLSGSSSTANVRYSWSGPGIVRGGTTSTPTVNVAGTYILTVTIISTGCTNNDIVVVDIDTTAPQVSAGGDKLLTCAITTTSLDGSSSTPDVSYTWTGPGIVSGSTTATPTVNISGTYLLTVTNNSTGCRNIDTTLLNIDINKPNVLAGNDKLLTCAITTTSLDGSSSTPNAVFSWRGPGIVSGAATATPSVNTIGTYILNILNPNNGCSAEDTVVVTNDIIQPNISAGSDKLLTCTISNVSLDGSSSTPNTTFLWSGPSIIGQNNIAVATANAIGTYSLVVTDTVNGCVNYDTLVVREDRTAPGADAGNADTLTCAITSLALLGSSPTAMAQYAWSGIGIVSGANTATPTVNAAGWYLLTTTHPTNGCSSIDSVAIASNIVAPQVSAGGDKLLTCAITTTSLDGSSSTPNVSYTWTGPGIVSGSTTATPTVNISGTYLLTVTNNSTGCRNIDTTLLNIDINKPNVLAGNDKLLTCAITTTSLDGSSSTPNAVFSWRGPGIVSGAATATPSVNTIGTYILNILNPNNGCSAEDTVVVTNDIIQPNISAGSDKLLTCTISNVSLDGSSSTPNTTFLWSGPSIIGQNNIAVATANAIGTYSLVVTDTVNGCVNYDTLVVREDRTAPGADAGNADTLTCAITSLALLGSSPTAMAQYAWSGIGIVSGANTATPTVNAAGWYLLTTTHPTNGCSSIDSVAIASNIVAPQVSAGGDKLLTCAITTTSLDGSSSTPNVSYTWTGPGIVSGSTTSTPIVNISGTYLLTVTNNSTGCRNIDTTLVSIDINKPNVLAGNDKLLTCAITTTSLDGSSSTPNAVFSWRGPGIVSGAATATPSVNTIGTYILNILNPNNGCSAEDTVVVTNDIIQPNISAGSDKLLTCTISNVSLDGSSSTPNTTFLWSGPSIIGQNNIAVATANAIGTYSLVVTDTVNGCVNYDTLVVREDRTAPGADAGNADTLTCAITSLALLGSSPTAMAQYAWSGIGIVSGANTATPTVNAAGWYLLTTTHPTNGCSSIDSVAIASNIVAPQVSAGGDKLLTCAITTTSLDGSSSTPNVSYTWTGHGIVSGSTTATPIVNISGTYLLTVTDNKNKCSNTDTTFLAIDTIKPIIQLNTNKNEICPNEVYNLSITSNLSNFTIFRNNNVFLNTINKSIQNNMDGVYYVTAVNSINGCSGRSNTVSITNKPKPTILISSDHPLNRVCSFDSIQLFTDDILEDYIWYKDNVVFDESNNPSIFTNIGGKYSISAENSVGCRDTSNVIDIIVDEDFVYEIGEDTFVCKNSTILLDANIDADTYLWNTGHSGRQLEIDEIGFYSVIVTKGACSHEDELFVAYGGSTPDYTLGEDTIVGCLLKKVTLNAPKDIYYIWEDSTRGIVRDIYNPGTYSIAMQNQCGWSYDTTVIIFDTCTCNVYVANAFTPNADGRNETFSFINECNTTASLVIHNRWGMELFSTIDANNGWDGTHNGELQPQDTYIYVLQYYDRYEKKSKTIKGSFILLR